MTMWQAIEAWLRRGNNAVMVVLPLFALAAVAVLLADPDAETMASPEQMAVQSARMAECQAVIDAAKAQGLIVQTDANRIEIDDRIWQEMMAADKRALGAAFACAHFQGRAAEDLAMMDYVVIYGQRSGQRLAMAGSEGVALE